MIDGALAELEPVVGRKPGCALVGRSRATHYRALQPPVHGPKPRRPSPPNAMSQAEREEVLAVLRSAEYCDLAVAQVWARELDAGRYFCSISSMYRVLRGVGEVHERRSQATHPARVKPELVASGPNEVWSWDITKLKGPDRGIYYDLYVILDIYSRYVVAWLLAPAESGELAKDLIADAIKRHGVVAGQLTIHADRGTSMTSKPVSALLVDLGVIRSHSRPQVSNDNPYSESQFKTLKYCPAFPARFGSIQDARAFVEIFMAYYCHEHRHSGIGLHTPASVHYGTAQQVRAQRAATLDKAYAATPNRFSHRPTPPKLPTIAWINPPVVADEEVAQSA